MAECCSPETETGRSVRRRIKYPNEMWRKTVERMINQVFEGIFKGDITSSIDYSQTCENLGSNLNTAIAMNEAPSSTYMPQLLWILREVHKRKTELLPPSLMLLMLPIKAACQNGWFSDKDKDYLLMMVKEVFYKFSNTDKMSLEPDNAEFYVSYIISRFYPNMKVESTITSFIVKDGYGCFVADFHFSKDTFPHHDQNLWLLVARTDNMDTAACIVTPSDVDFLINGMEVPMRTRNDMCKEPQLPSNVTKKIKHGVNLLQIFGNFDGPHIIVLAFMSMISSPDPSHLQDHVNPMSSEIDPDCDFIGVSSRISLDCPVSKCRIKTPVKGHLCKHPQCFDYECFMDDNSKRPTWKCPLCDMAVCSLDIRIDRNFVKILDEVVGYVREVIISPDGSWTAVMPEKNQATATNTTSQSNYVNNTTGTVGSDHMVRSCSSGSGINVKEECSHVTMAATVSPPVQPFEDACLQPHHSCCMIGTPSVQPTTMTTTITLTTTRPMNVLTSPNQSPGETQTDRPKIGTRPMNVLTGPNQSPGVSQADGPSQPKIGTSTPERVQNGTVFTPVQLTPSPHYSQSQSRTSLTSSSPQFHSPATATSTNSQSVRVMGEGSAPQVQPQPQITSNMHGDGRMRGSLRGDRLVAARIQYLAPPQQSIYATEPLPRPTPPLFKTVRMLQTLTNLSNSDCFATLKPSTMKVAWKPT